jgi:hypothetical protein
MRRILLALALSLIPVSLAATTIVVFRTPGSIVLATDSGAVGVDANGRHHITIDCKIRKAGPWWFLIGGFLKGEDVDARQWIASRIAPTTTLGEALAALNDRSLLDRIIANQALYPGRQPGSPLMTVVIASPDLTLGVMAVTLKAANPFEVTAESGVCPGAICPTGNYFLAGEPGDAPPNPLLKALPPWFQRGDAAAARRFIEDEIRFVPQLARPPIDVIEITRVGARWVDQDAQSACAAIPENSDGIH